MSNISEMIAARLSAGYSTLDEHQAKLVLSEYSTPVNSENLAFSEEEAVASALEIGFPVVLKGCAPDLKHKSELGMVHLNIGNESELRSAYKSLIDKAGSLVDSVIVQGMLS